MVLCNIVITQIAKKDYVVNINGRKRVKVCNITYIEPNVDAGTHKLICIRSNILRFPYGTNNNLTFVNQPAHQVSNIAGDMWMDCEFNGTVDIELVDLRGNAQANFNIATLMLDVCDYELPEMEEQHYKHPELKPKHHKK